MTEAVEGRSCDDVVVIATGQAGSQVAASVRDGGFALTSEEAANAAFDLRTRVAEVPVA